MVKLSTSKHNINADYRLSFFNKLKWFALNYFNNINEGSNIDPELINQHFKIKDILLLSNSPADKTPSRTLCNLYWSDLDWQYITLKLKNKIDVLEVGCGTGNYGRLLSQKLGPSLNSYTGIDLFRQEEWSEFNSFKNFKFKIGTANNINQDLTGKNFIFTQSAIEHFENDLLFFKDLARYVHSVNYPVFQLHFFPSPACLFTYLLHGFRQYTPTSVSQITRHFNSNSDKYLVHLGGSECNKTHFKYITLPNLIFKSSRINGSNYKKELQRSILRDMEYKSSASFYGLMILSNFNS